MRTAHAAVMPVNVEALFDAHRVPEEPDVLSIDINSAHYWV